MATRRAENERHIMFSQRDKKSNYKEKRSNQNSKKIGGFQKIEHPELLSIQEQIKYYAAKKEADGGGDQYRRLYLRDDADFPWPYKYMIASDK